MFDSWQSHGLYSPWNSPGKNTGVGNLSLLCGIFPTQGSNSGLPHCRQILYQWSHQGSPRILGWVTCPFSSRSSQPRNQSRVSCIAGRCFTSWATREALLKKIMFTKEDYKMTGNFCRKSDSLEEWLRILFRNTKTNHRWWLLEGNLID